jgi:hypothetical protein
MSDHYFTRDETLSQIEAWEQALQVTSLVLLPRVAGYEHVVFTGCSSVHYLSLSAAAPNQEVKEVALTFLESGLDPDRPQDLTAVVHLGL